MNMNVEKTGYVRKEKLTKEEFLRVEKDYFVKPTVDIIFKMLFADEGNIGMLKNFLATFLEINESEMEEIVIQNPEIPPVDERNKAVRLDIRIGTADREIDVEMQVSKQDFYKSRTLYYWASMFLPQVDRGDEAYITKETICLNVLDFLLFPEKQDYFTTIKLVDIATQKVFCEDLRLLFLELPKMKTCTLEALNANQKLAWLAFLKATKKEDLAMLEQVNNTQVQAAATKLGAMQYDPNLKYSTYSRECQMDEEKLNRFFSVGYGMQRGMQKGIKKGRQEGVQKGKQDTQKEIAMGMASEGLDNELIKRLTGIDVSKNYPQKWSE